MLTCTVYPLSPNETIGALMDFIAGQMPYMVAEISSNHGGNLQQLLNTIAAAKEAGADAIKIQTYSADTLTVNAFHPTLYIHGGQLHVKRLYDLYKECETPREWHDDIFTYCETVGIDCFSTPFTIDDVIFLEQYEPIAYKVASFELTEPNLLSYLASTNRPIILSTGMATHKEIDVAYKLLTSNGSDHCHLLHCVSEYPTPAKDMRMREITYLRDTYPRAIVGLSDHTLSNAAAVAAVTLGARIIEKHFKIDDKVITQDSSFSITPKQFKSLVTDVHDTVSMLNFAALKESKNLKFRRSVYAVANIKRGEHLTQENVRSVRPSDGIAPHFLSMLWESYEAARDIEKGEPIVWSSIKQSD